MLRRYHLRGFFIYMFYVYKITIKRNKSYYIGVTCNPDKRKQEHFRKLKNAMKYALLKENKHRKIKRTKVSPYWYTAACSIISKCKNKRKYNLEECVSFKIIYSSLSIEDCSLMEMSLIKPSSKCLNSYGVAPYHSVFKNKIKNLNSHIP